MNLEEGLDEKWDKKQENATKVNEFLAIFDDHEVYCGFEKYGMENKFAVWAIAEMHKFYSNFHSLNWY